MTTRKNTDDSRDRIDLRVKPELYDRIAHQARRFGGGLSNYVREAVIRRLEADEAGEPTKRRART
jgi:hypothetical protein